MALRKQPGKKLRSKSKRTQKSKARLNAKKAFARTIKAQDRSNTIARVISKMRADGISLQKAARQFSVDPRTVIRHGRSAVRKLANGRWVSRPDDRISRVLLVPTSNGLSEISVRDSRQASQLGKYWDSVQRYLETGNSSGLQKFIGKSITNANGQQIPLLTDLDELDRQGSAGVLSFESVYARSA